VIGFDINRKRIGDLRAGVDIAREVESAELAQATLVYESDPAALTAVDFYIVTVLTPIDDARIPDLGAILSASEIVGAVLKRGNIVVYEATVYPGAVEEDCVPVLEKTSGLSLEANFSI
jgi:UDP-N-acetyl-D-galactosamine dehydrogenase